MTAYPKAARFRSDMWGVPLFLSWSHPPPEFSHFLPLPHHAHHWHTRHTRHIPPARHEHRTHEPRSTQAHTLKQAGYTNSIQYSNKTKDEGENKRVESFCNEGIANSTQPRALIQPRAPMPYPEARSPNPNNTRQPCPGDPRTLDPTLYQFLATCQNYLTLRL